ncbi:MAG TPA: cytidylate kinase family protein [Candidatus Paceibacterota bacterium]|nr:cytidylate kinase family protein [Candidatus Paceibacterota bacterium]
MKKEIITIAGTAGSGKSSTANLVAQKLGFKRFSSGDFMRKIALELNMSLDELSTKAETDSSIDEKIDAEVKKAGENTKLVIDSRLAFHWIPDSFKVFLDLSPEIAKNRILSDLKTNTLRKQSEDASSPEEIYKKITDRLESEKKRYMQLYNIDYTDKNNYDLVINTDINNLEEVANIVVTGYKNWLEK